MLLVRIKRAIRSGYDARERRIWNGISNSKFHFSQTNNRSREMEGSMFSTGWVGGCGLLAKVGWLSLGRFT